MKDKPEILYPYNESFKRYAEPRAGKRAQEFVDFQNTLKGGHWVLHTKEQYYAWYEKTGRAQEEARLQTRG